MADGFDAQFIAICGRAGRREGHRRRGHGRADRPGAGPPHHPLRRRGAPLQQGPAGRLPASTSKAACSPSSAPPPRTLVRGQLGAALARPRVRAAVAHARRAVACSSTAPWPRSTRAAAARASPPYCTHARGARAAGRLGRRRRAPPHQRGRGGVRIRPRPPAATRSTPTGWKPRLGRTCAASTRAARPSTTRSAPCTNRCAAPTRTLPSYRFAAHARRRRRRLATWRAASCAWPGKTSAWPSPAPCRCVNRRGRHLRAPGFARRRARRWARPTSTWPSRPRATPATTPTTRPASSPPSTAARAGALHLRNAPTKLMKELGYGHAYRYAHDEPHGYAAGEQHCPRRPECQLLPPDRPRPGG